MKIHIYKATTIKDYKIINVALCGASGEIKTSFTKDAITCGKCRFMLVVNKINKDFQRRNKYENYI